MKNEAQPSGIICDKCGAIMTGSVCQRCGASVNSSSDSESESGNGGSGNEGSGNGGFTGGGLGKSPFSGGGSANSPFSGGAVNSPFSGGGAAKSPFSRGGAAPSPFAGGGAAPSPFAGGGAAPSPFGGSGSGNSAFGGSAFGFGAFGNGGVSNTGYGSEEEVAEKNKNALISKLERYKDLLAENEELDTMIKPQSSFPASEEMGFKKRSFIKYFWPFVVAAPVAGYLIYFISSMIAMSSINSYDTSFMTQAEVQAISNKIMSDTYMGMLVAIIVAAAIIIFGIVLCKRKQSEFNSNAEYMNRQASERYQKGLENQRMINLKQSNIQQMYQYESMVPKEYRTSFCVGKLIEYIQNDEAKTVEEACELLKSETAS